MSIATNQPVQLIGLGEVLWDCFPDRRLPGGAPANVAFHAQQLGLSAAVASRVGGDELGGELCQFLLDQGMTTDLIQRDANRETGTVTIWPGPDQSVNYRILENSAWDFLEPTAELQNAVASASAICFGTLAQRRPVTRNAIAQCLQAASKNCLVVFDVNLRPPFVVKEWISKSLDRATIVKLNHDEVKVLSQLLGFRSSDEIRFGKELLDRHNRVELVCVTRGAHGCLAVTCSETIELPGIPIAVADTVGAGDAFTAGIIYGRLQEWSLQRTVDLANRFGSLVASRPGAMPVLQIELQALKSELDWAYRDTQFEKR